MRLALTMGDPAGIGPEVVLKTLHRHETRDAVRHDIVVCGARASLEKAADILGLKPQFVDPYQNSRWPDVPLLETSDAADSIIMGTPSAQSGRLAFAAIERAVGLATQGTVAGIVTAPISKEALHLAGYPFSGHTELLAALTNGSEPVMMLAHGSMRVTHLSTHVSLKDVPSKLTPARLERVIRITWDTLRHLGIDRPRIGVAALNPHSGEGGIFGREDIDVTAGVVARLRTEGIGVDGPVPGDTVFVKHQAGQFDAVVAMYHDQGHIPVKLLGFSIDPETGEWVSLSGVNVTLGLPIIRTSPDHGTAYDIAGRGIANDTSLFEAVQYAALLAGHPTAPRPGDGVLTEHAASRDQVLSRATSI